MNEPSYTLIDPRPIVASAPYTFFLPSEDEIAAVGVGDSVKLLFDYPHDTEKWATERMWVLVEEVDGDQIRGSLDNHPDEPTSPLKPGDPVAFGRHHIISIYWAKPDEAPPAPECYSYLERCLVDKCVLDDGVPVEYLYREQPDLGSEGDEHADSGWRIRGLADDATDAEMEARQVEYVALGAVLNRDDSWVEWIGAPVGTRIIRDFETNTYEEAS